MTPTAFKLQSQISGAIKKTLKDHPEINFNIKYIGVLSKNLAAQLDNIFTLDVRSEMLKEAKEQIQYDTDVAVLTNKIAELLQSNKYLVSRLKEHGINPSKPKDT